ncbi:LamG-like jellyroll fold domain-containing protein [Lacinutrix undariae]
MKLLPSFQTTFLCLFLAAFTFQVSAQTTIVKNEFYSNYETSVADSGSVTSGESQLSSDDNWEFTAYVDNGKVYYPGTNGNTSVSSVLNIRDYWTGIDYVEFDEIDISGKTDVGFSFSFATNNNLSSGDYINLTYWIDGVQTDVTLHQGGNGALNFMPAVDDGTFQSNRFKLNIGSASTFKFKLELSADASPGGNEIIYIDDVFLTTNSTTGSGAVGSVNLTYCMPINIGVNNQFYISNVLFGDIDNPSDNSANNYEYYTTPTTDLAIGDDYPMVVDFVTNSYNTTGLVVWIDFNNDGDFDDANEKVYSATNTPTVNSGSHTFSVSVPSTAILGVTRMRLAIKHNNVSSTSCTNDNQKGEFEDYNVNIISALAPYPRIQISGNSTIITNNDDTPSATDDTDFGIIDVGQSQINTYTIENTGTGNLTVNSITLSPFAPTSTQFVLINNPATITLASGASTTFQVEFAPTNESTENAKLVINSSDTATSNYEFKITGDADQKFYDSDNDGIYDNVDVDDDNDGILDVDEQNACAASSSATTTNYKFLNETFGVGPGRGNAISTLYTATTTYCLEDGTASANTIDCVDLNDPSLNDGEYTINHKITSGASGEFVGPGDDDAIASWAHRVWANTKDHTPDDADNDDSPYGNMAIFNASNDPGVFYQTTITGTLPGVPVSYSFWVMNIDNKYSNLSGGDTSGGTRIKPNITVKFLRTDGTLISKYETDDILRCSGDNDCDMSEWQLFEPPTISTDESEFIVQFINNSPGGLGNDLAIDDIKIQQTLCDSDGDGIADVFDLDSDNDGIPDIVEAGLGAYSNGTATVDTSIWVDANNDGLHDGFAALSTQPVLDTDNDGVPNYLDLDSDNDGLFDVDESGMGNTNSTDVNYVNGDGDISGNGVGQGLDTEEFREKDTDGDGNIEYFGDGILDVYDFLEGTTFGDSYGNSGQINGTYLVVDTDGDGTPDYLDTTSNGTSYDIANTIYADLDADNDGLIDDGQSGNFIDSDNDGVPDSRDGDDTIFGSPRDLNKSYSLYFDGRNDYVEDDNILSNTDATLMAFVKKEGNNKLETVQQVVGQNKFLIRINKDNSIRIRVNNSNLETGSIVNGIWSHIAATTTAGKTILYVNGIKVDSLDSGGIVTDVTKFRIGARSNNKNYFKGEIEEVRVFDRALSEQEIQRMVYQELDENENFNMGKIIPQTIGALNTNLVRYFKMDGYLDDILDDKKTDPANRDLTAGARLYNIKLIYPQTAPLPYVTKAAGEWTVSNSWLHGGMWDITTKANNPDDISIVHIKHNLNVATTQGTLGLLVDDDAEFSIQDDKGLFNSWYLKLDGFIDLEGESQLVQTENSNLYTSATAKLERDQQGTVNKYTYNYWSSPVHTSNAVGLINGTETYTIAGVLRDGTDVDNPAAISYVGGYDGSTSPMEIADYWLWKFDNFTSNNYSDWQSLSSTSKINAGVGYTMKGTADGDEDDEQNYVFEGKPNNGTYSHYVNAGNEYLVGNPYPSAIDANEFILDNTNSTGTLYFWEHYGGGTHVLAGYQGSYGVYNLIGGTSAFSPAGISSGGSSSKTPKQYIPVAQGFFVVGRTDGNISFENDQRAFVTEGASNTNSWFFRQATSVAADEEILLDTRPKLRIGFTAPNNYKRQLLLGVDENATTAIDWGYDAELNEVNSEDFTWYIEDKDFLIQGVGELTETTILPLSVKTNAGGTITITIDDLVNVEETLPIYLKDGEVYHDLRASEYTITVNSGVINGRFAIVFALPDTLSTVDLNVEGFSIYPNPTQGIVTIKLPSSGNYNGLEIVLYDIQGRLIKTRTVENSQTEITFNDLETLSNGVYIIKINEGVKLLVSSKLIKI